jgi:hypothetical protein
LTPLLQETYNVEQEKIMKIDYGRNKLAVLSNPAIKGSFVFASAQGNELGIKWKCVVLDDC